MPDLFKDAQECMPVMTGKCYRNAAVSSEFEDKVRIELDFFLNLGPAPDQKDVFQRTLSWIKSQNFAFCLYTHCYVTVHWSKGLVTRQTIVTDCAAVRLLSLLTDN